MEAISEGAREEEHREGVGGEEGEVEEAEEAGPAVVGVEREPGGCKGRFGDGGGLAGGVERGVADEG